MRIAAAITLFGLVMLPGWTAGAVTLINLNPDRAEVLVCDETCGPSHGDDWGSARNFWMEPGESRSVDCSGQCFVGLYYDGHSPTLGDMAMADEDELFQGNETAYIQGGFVSHHRK